MAFESKNNLLVKYIGIGSDENVVIPANVTTISKEAFSNNEIIKSVIIPDSVASIGFCAFSGCINLVDIKFPANIRHIGVDAFDDTKWLGDYDGDFIIIGKDI